MPAVFTISCFTQASKSVCQYCHHILFLLHPPYEVLCPSGLFLTIHPNSPTPKLQSRFLVISIVLKLGCVLRRHVKAFLPLGFSVTQNSKSYCLGSKVLSLGDRPVSQQSEIGKLRQILFIAEPTVQEICSQMQITYRPRLYFGSGPEKQ